MPFILLSVITFLSAFLLFQIELIVAKLFLPIYGGSYLVWGACLVFFQAILFLGYVGAHYFISRLGIHQYLKIHQILLFLPLLFFPGRAIDLPENIGSLPLVMDVFWQLLITIGPVFFILSTFSLVTQSWLANSSLNHSRYPYLLYGISNAGSFLALLTYPFIFELSFTNTQMLDMWRIAYIVLVVLNVLTFKLIPVSMKEIEKLDSGDVKDGEQVSLAQMIRWLALSAGGVILFLSVTNIMTYEIAPIPLLWIIPLSIYLLSFVLCFKEKPFFPKWMQALIPSLIILSAVLFFQSRFILLPPIISLVLFILFLMCLCMHVQYELITSKPNVRKLTLFYVMISLGGFLGGFFTSWIVPLISNAPVEFLIGLIVVALCSRLKWVRFTLAGLLLIALLGESLIDERPTIYKHRNYYGIYRIEDNESKTLRSLVHGTTLHGLQYLEPDKKWIPLGYYSPKTPIGEVLGQNFFDASQVGVVGLGAGSTAVFTTPKMSMDFYELDPDVLDIAKEYFSYLSFSPGPVKVILGDARLKLQDYKGDPYDLLVIDAFGGDSIPAHLVNVDVLKKYRNVIKNDGVIMFHISNRYFSLEPIIANIASQAGAMAAFKTNPVDPISLETAYAIITWDKGRFDALINNHGWKKLTPDMYPAINVWRDDYSSVLPIIKWDRIKHSIVSFKLWGK